MEYSVKVTLTQRGITGNPYNTGTGYASGFCRTYDPVTFTVTVFGNGPFHVGPTVMDPRGYICTLDCFYDEQVKDVMIRS